MTASDLVPAAPDARASTAQVFVAGRDYQVLARPAAPAAAGKSPSRSSSCGPCVHCFAFEPELESWAARSAELRRADARACDLQSRKRQLLARAFYTAAALGKGDAMHAAFYEEIHTRGNPPASREALAGFSRASASTPCRIRGGVRFVRRSTRAFARRGARPRVPGQRHADARRCRALLHEPDAGGRPSAGGRRRARRRGTPRGSLCRLVAGSTERRGFRLLRFEKQPVGRVIGLVPVRVAEVRQVLRETRAVGLGHLHAGQHAAVVRRRDCGSGTG